MNQERQDVADQQTFAKGDPEHLILAQTNAMSDPLDVRLMPEQDGAGLLRLLGFLAHTSILPSTSLRRPFRLLLPSRRPELAPLLQMLPLLKLLLPEVAAHHRVAALIDAISEVLAGHADHTAFPALKVMVVDKIPLLHHHPGQHRCTSQGGDGRSSGGTNWSQAARHATPTFDVSGHQGNAP